MNIDPRFAKTMWVAEVDTFSSLSLWEDADSDGHTWFQDSGLLIAVGMMKEYIGPLRKPKLHPVCMSVFWNVIDGRYVIFWEATSAMVDRKMIHAWWDANCAPKTLDGRPARSDAMNFAHCLHEIAAQATLKHT